MTTDKAADPTLVDKTIMLVYVLSQPCLLISAAIAGTVVFSGNGNASLWIYGAVATVVFAIAWGMSIWLGLRSGVISVRPINEILGRANDE